MVPAKPYYLFSAEGTFRFTSTGKAKLRERFHLAGVCMDDIRTYGEYIHAQRKASDHFGEWLFDITHNLPNQGQYALLRAALLDTPQKN